jgi:hypothetical protein
MMTTAETEMRVTELGFFKAMKIKASLRMQFLGSDKITIRQDAKYTTFDSQLSIDNSLGDDSERFNEPEEEMSPDGVFNVASLDTSFNHVWSNLNVVSHGQIPP